MLCESYAPCFLITAVELGCISIQNTRVLTYLKTEPSPPPLVGLGGCVLVGSVNDPTTAYVLYDF